MAKSRRKSKGTRTPDAEDSTPMDDAPAPSPTPLVDGEPLPVPPPPEDPTPAAPEITARDVSATPTTLDSDEWPRHPWPAGAGERGGGFQVVFHRSALNAIHAHGRSSPEVEICGVLVGQVARDDAGPFLLVEAIVRGDFAGTANAQVTFTAETWNHIQRVMEAEHPDRKIVGWYHTHPSFGIFLSDMDLFIHGNFFNMPWQVAFVYDPVSSEEGLFVWRDGKTERTAFAVDEDAEKEIPTVAVSAEITAAALADFSRRVQGLERRLRTLSLLVPLGLLVALAWPFVLFTVMNDQHGGMRNVLPRQPKASDLRSASPAAVVRPAPPTTRGSGGSICSVLTSRFAATEPTTRTVAVTPPPPATTQATGGEHTAGQATTRPATVAPGVIRPPATTEATRGLEPPAEAKP